MFQLPLPLSNPNEARSSIVSRRKRKQKKRKKPLLLLLLLLLCGLVLDWMGQWGWDLAELNPWKWAVNAWNCPGSYDKKGNTAELAYRQWWGNPCQGLTYNLNGSMQTANLGWVLIKQCLDSIQKKMRRQSRAQWRDDPSFSWSLMEQDNSNLILGFETLPSSFQRCTLSWLNFKNFSKEMSFLHYFPSNYLLLLRQ